MLSNQQHNMPIGIEASMQVLSSFDLPYLSDISAAVSFGFANSSELYSLFYQQRSGALFVYRLAPDNPTLRAVAVHTRTIAPGLSWLMPVQAGDMVFLLARTSDRRLLGYTLVYDHPRIIIREALVPLMGLAHVTACFATAHHLLTYSRDPISFDMVLTAYPIITDVARGTLQLASAGQSIVQDGLVQAVALPFAQPDDYFLAYLASGGLAAFRVDAQTADLTALPLAEGSRWPYLSGMTRLLACWCGGPRVMGYTYGGLTANSVLSTIALDAGAVLVRQGPRTLWPGGQHVLGASASNLPYILSYNPTTRGGAITVYGCDARG